MAEPMTMQIATALNGPSTLAWPFSVKNRDVS